MKDIYGNDLEETIEEIISSINSIENFDDMSDHVIEDLMITPISSIINEATWHRAFDNMKQEGKLSKEGLDYEYNRLINIFNEKKNDIDTSSIKKQSVFLKIQEVIIGTLKKAIDDYNFNDVVIHIQKIHENARIPSFAHTYDAGADVYAVSDVEVAPHATVIVPTGLKMAIPNNWKVSVRPRSGMSAKTNIRIANAPGTIDAGYLDEVGIIVTNIGEENYMIHAGDRIAQFVVEKRYDVAFVECEDVNEYSDINRANSNGNSGFGSTGN